MRLPIITCAMRRELTSARAWASLTPIISAACFGVASIGKSDSSAVMTIVRIQTIAALPSLTLTFARSGERENGFPLLGWPRCPQMPPRYSAIMLAARSAASAALTFVMTALCSASVGDSPPVIATMSAIALCGAVNPVSATPAAPILA